MITFVKAVAWKQAQSIWQKWQSGAHECKQHAPVTTVGIQCMLGVSQRVQSVSYTTGGEHPNTLVFLCFCR